MAIKNNRNKYSEKAEMMLTSAGTALVAASAIPDAPIVVGWAGILFNLAALPFGAYNSSLIRKQLDTIIKEVNKLETRMEKLENLTEEQRNIFLLNEYKFFDYCLREKMKEKIKAYARILSNGVNDGTVFEEDDSFDIQMDIVNSLRIEDIVLIKQINRFLELYYPSLEEAVRWRYISCNGFSKGDLVQYVRNSKRIKGEFNENAFRHLISLGLISEFVKGKIENVSGHMSITGDDIFRYSLTKRCKEICEKIIEKEETNGEKK